MTIWGGNIQRGGTQDVPQIAVQYIYLDFDGELTSYNGEILSLDTVEVQNSSLTEERIQNILAELNARYADQHVVFVTQRPTAAEYSTIFIGKTSAFDQYGAFRGLAETIDEGNVNKNDKAFVNLDSTATDTEIIATIAHETDHLTGTLNHGGSGLAAYAAHTIIGSGTTSTGLILSYGNSITVSSGGTATSTTVNPSGYLYVSSGGTATVVFNPWQGTISSDNGATVTYLERDANVYYGGGGSGLVSKADVMSELQVTAGNSAIIYSGGTATSTEVNSGGWLYVSSGTVDRVSVDNGGFLECWSGDITTILVQSGGKILIQQSASVGYVHASEGARFKFGINTETYVRGTSNGSGFEIKNGVVDDLRMFGYADGDYDYLTISSGCVANNTRLFGGHLYVYNGAVARNTIVESGGQLWVCTNDSFASDTVVSSGGTMYLGRTTSGKPVVAYDTLVKSGGYLRIDSGIHRGSLQLEAGAVVSAYEEGFIDFTVSDRTTADDYLVNDLSLITGAPTYTITVSADQESGTYKLAQGASDFSGTISIGDATTVYGTITVNGETFRYNDTNYTLTQNNGDLLLNITEARPPSVFIYSSSTLTSSGTAITGAELISGGNDSMFVSSGGTATSTTVNSGGRLSVSSGGTATATTVNSDGYLSVSSGGTATDTTVNSWGTMYVYDGGTVTSTTANGGWLYVSTGGTVTDIIVNSSGGIAVSSGAIVNNGTVDYGGELEVHDGGTADYVNVLSGGRLETFTWPSKNGTGNYSITNLVLRDGARFDLDITVQSYIHGYSHNDSPRLGEFEIKDGIINNFYISEGDGIRIHDGCVATNTRIEGTADDYRTAGMFVYGGAVANNTSLSGAGNYLDIFGGSAITTTVSDNARIIVEDNGTATSTTVNAAGSMYVSSGSTATSTTVNSGGRLWVYSGGIHRGSLQLEAGSVVSAYEGSVIDFTVSDRTTAEDYLVNDLSLITGAPTYTITVSADQAAGSYKLAGNVGTFDTMLSLTVGSAIYENALQMNEVYLVDGKVYTLAKDNANGLILTVTEDLPPELVISGNATVWTNQDVTLTATATDESGQCKIEYFDDSVWIEGNHLTFSENGTYFFRATDSTGNVTEKSVVIDKIDKIAPAAPVVSADITDWTNSKVTVSADFDSDAVKKEYSYNSKIWCTYTSGVAFSTAGTIYFRAIDHVGNVSDITSYRVNNIDTLAPQTPVGLDVVEVDSSLRFDWKDALDAGKAGIAGYYVRYGQGDLTGEGTFVESSRFEAGSLAVGTWHYQVRSLDAAGNFSDWSDEFTFEVSPEAPTGLTGSAEGLKWEGVTGAASYIVEYSTDDFATVVTLESTTCAINSYALPEGTFKWRVRSNNGSDWAYGEEITSVLSESAKILTSDADGDMDLFFGNANGVWEAQYAAQHLGNAVWNGTKEKVLLQGKNKIADIFEGSRDANILVLTDDANGDALFVDDVYTALGDQARLAQIDEIRAGAGDDIVDMTSQRYAYAGDGVKVYGGLGNDTIWANKGSNTLFGDAGNDRLVGASGNDILAGGSGNDSMHGGGGSDIFTFGGAWGNDTIEQLADGSVTLWFADGSEANWDAESLTYSDGVNSVSVSGCVNVTLRFGSDASLSAGAFADAASEKIFEDKNSGMLA